MCFCAASAGCLSLQSFFVYRLSLPLLGRGRFGNFRPRLAFATALFGAFVGLCRGGPSLLEVLLTQLSVSKVGDPPATLLTCSTIQRKALNRACCSISKTFVEPVQSGRLFLRGQLRGCESSKFGGAGSFLLLCYCFVLCAIRNNLPFLRLLVRFARQCEDVPG